MAEGQVFNQATRDSDEPEAWSHTLAPGVPGARVRAYYLDTRLSLGEGTRRFADDGSGRETPKEGYYTVAIRRTGGGDWVFRFSSHDRAAPSILQTLNRPVMPVTLSRPAAADAAAWS